MQWQCMPRCRSQDHGTAMAAAITCGTSHQVKTFVLSHCLNPFHIMDATGRNLLHVAASCGKLEVMEWLLEHGADVRVKDKESGWTPLHRSTFYGQISCAIHLIRVSQFADPVMLEINCYLVAQSGKPESGGPQHIIVCIYLVSKLYTKN